MEKPKVIQVLMPVYKQLSSRSFVSFWDLMWYLRNNYEVYMNFVENTLIGHARDELLKKVVENHRTNKIDYVLWLDSDHIYTIEAFEALRKDIDQYGLDMVSALYFSRKSNDEITPVMMVKSQTANKYNAIYEIPENKLMKVDVAGFGYLMMKPDVLIDVYATYPEPFNIQLEEYDEAVGEDILFLEKAKKLGYDIWVDTGVVVRHVGGSIGMDNYLLHRTNKGEMRK
jgi:hypothetical protein